MLMYWILYRIPEAGITELFETDDLTDAVHVLQGAVISGYAHVIDFSGDLDGYLDVILDGVKLFSDPALAETPAKAA